MAASRCLLLAYSSVIRTSLSVADSAPQTSPGRPCSWRTAAPGVGSSTDVNASGGKDPAPTVFVKGSRYELLMEAFGGKGVVAATPAELQRALQEAVASGQPTLINALIDETAGTESGRITSLNPQKAAIQK